MIRLFAGLPLPAEVADGLTTTLGSGIPNSRWVEARNLHITLRFIGEVEEGLARELHDALAELRCPAFDLSLTGFGTFGRASPNHLWVGVERAPGLLQLQSKVDSTVTRAGLAPEGRKYTPHVTLARFKNAPVNRIQDFITRNSPFQAGPWRADHFILYRSHLGRSGAEYEAVAEYGLG